MVFRTTENIVLTDGLFRFVLAILIEKKREEAEKGSDKCTCTKYMYRLSLLQILSL